MKERQETPIWIVEKFIPARCPKCERVFGSPADFSRWAGVAEARSFAEALKIQVQKYPEIYQVNTRENGGLSAKNRFHMDFIMCGHCQNVTLRIHYAEKHVTSFAEAEKLKIEEGYNCIGEGVALGKPHLFSDLSFLGLVDLKEISSLIRKARERAGEESDETDGGDCYDQLVYRALLNVSNKLRENSLTREIRNKLKNLFGVYWGSLTIDCRDFLITAEVLREELSSLTDTDPAIDFSPAVAAYSKALEKELLEKVFYRFANSSYADRLPVRLTNMKWEKSLTALRLFVNGRKELALGEMAYIITNLGNEMMQIKGNGFAEFLIEKLIDPADFFCGKDIPRRLINYIKDYRNRSAHVSKLPKKSVSPPEHIY